MKKFLATSAVAALAIAPMSVSAQQADTVRLQTTQSTQNSDSAPMLQGPGAQAAAAAALGIIFIALASSDDDDDATGTTND